MSVMYKEVGSRESDASTRGSLIFFVMQPLSYSFACHVVVKLSIWER